MTAWRWLESPRLQATWITLALALALWVALGVSVRSGIHGAHAGHAEAALSAAPVQVLSTAAIWLLMMFAMMLPTAAPMIAAYADVCAREARGARLAQRVMAFGAGYLALWGVYALVAAAIQVGAQGTGLVQAGGGDATPFVAAALLSVAGVYQWLPVKRACLRHCRSPLAFLLANWRSGVAGGFRVGLRHGWHCLGCCAALMGLMFVFGTMRLWAMAALALYCVAERVVPGAERWGRWVGAMLLVAGATILGRELI